MVREIIGIPVGNNEVVKDCEMKECTSELTEGDISSEQQDVLYETTNFHAENPEKKSDKTDDQKVNSPIKPSSETAAVENVRKKSTPQNISDVTVDKQASTPVVTKNYIDEDNWSVASSTAVSEQTARSRVTTGVAPTFASDERIQKRKEYYAKLEEKRKALAAERREYEARSKEEEETAIKELRKSMVHRANPVPSFYYEKPPPKKELKKLPTTIPTSPKFARRKSCSDAISLFSEEKVRPRARSARYS